MNDRTFQTLSALRIYLKRGDNKRAPQWWGRLFERPLSTHLVQAALHAGVTHASVNLGHMGFVKGASEVTHDITEIPMTTLPVCVELVGTRRLLEQFVRDQAKHVKDATLIMVDGLHFSADYLDEMHTAIEKRPHEVEYIQAGKMSVPVEHVDVDCSRAAEPVNDRHRDKTPEGVAS